MCAILLFETGKERVFVEVARALRKKVYVTAAKLRILECLDFKQEDMQWFTTNEHESHIHIVPMWSIASFKRLDHMSKHYMVTGCAKMDLTKVEPVFTCLWLHFT